MIKSFLLLSILLILYFENLRSQEVVVVLTAKQLDVPKGIDTIVLVNLTQPDTAYLYPLPTGITSYYINLMTGAVSNIDKMFFRNSSFVFLPYVNKPGYLQILLNLPSPENFIVTLNDATGKIILSKRLYAPQGFSYLNLESGNIPFGLLRITGYSHQATFKFAGDPFFTNNPDIFLSNHTNPTVLLKDNFRDEVAFDFNFSPGDEVKFMARKSGWYSNYSIVFPQNGDSVNVYISQPCPGSPLVYDFDQNAYTTVQIGNQCWFRENVKSIHYSDGTQLVDGSGAGNISGDFTTKYWFDYNDDPSNSITFGKLYTAAAALNGIIVNSDTQIVQGVCPAGWHVPLDLEWMRMEAVLGMKADTNWVYAWRGTDQGDQLKESGYEHWIFINNGNDRSGFNALPSGYREHSGSFYTLGRQANWWNSLRGDAMLCNYRGIENTESKIFRGYTYTDNALSVRCIKD